MADQNPQDARREAEDRMTSQIRREIEAEMNQRFGVAPPASKTIFEAGVSGAATAKEEGDFRGYLDMLQNTQSKMMEIARIQRRESKSFLDNLRQVERLQAKSLKSELDHYGLIKNRRQTMKDIRDLEDKGFERLQKEQQFRIKGHQADLAQAKALNQQGVPASYMVTQGIGGRAGDLAGAGEGNLIARMATMGGVRGYLGRQMEESGMAVKGGLSAGGITAAIPALIRANPYVAAATAAFYTVRGFDAGQGIYIPGVGSLPGTDYQKQILAGRVTGEGYGAGVASEFEALRMGWKPWDLISMQVAHQIVGATRGMGFRGQQGREFQNAIKGAYSQTGLPIDQLAQIGEIFARRGNLDQFRSSMEQIDDIARASSQSVAAVAQQIQGLTEQLVGQGAAPGLLPAAITAAVGGISGLTQQQRQGITTGFFGTEGLSRYSGFQGVTATTGVARRIAFQNQAMMLRSVKQNLTGMSKDQQDVYLGNMIQSGLFPGVDSIHALRQLVNQGPTAINDFRHQMSVGRMGQAFAAAGSAQARVHHDPNALGQILGHARGTAAFLGLDPTSLGIGPWHWSPFGHHHQDRTGERLAYVHALRHSLGQTHLTRSQVDRIVSPLERSLRGQDVRVGGHLTSLDWNKTVQLAQDRAKAFTERKHGQLNIRLDAAETKRLLSGKNVSKTVQLAHAVEGGAAYVGTAFADNLGF
jgi:hypothetical protein